MKEQLGERLRAAREARRLSLRAVAAAVGISPGTLSQVETGRIHPSVSNLYELVSYLETSVDELLGLPASYRSDDAVSSGATRPSDVQRGEDSPRIPVTKGVTWEKLANGGLPALDSLLISYEPGACSTADGALERHSGYEWGFVVEGELTLLLDFDQWTLRAGDSFAFDSQRPHLFRNDSVAPARGLWSVLGRTNSGVLPRYEKPQSGSVRSAVDILRSMHSLPSQLGEVDEAPQKQ